MTQLQKILFMGVVLVCLSAGVLFAAGNKEKPQIQVQTSGPQYLSPNGDGVKDTATLSFSVTLRIKSDKGFIPEYGLTIEDPNGTVVRTITQTEKSDINWFVKIFTGYKDFTLKKTITWDGKNNSGQVVPDGKYKARLHVIDANGNQRTADLSDFIVDTQPPKVTVSAPNGLLFSPNGDGHMDTLQIDQTDGTVEQLWTGTINSSDGKVVRTIKWENSAPKSFVWDGKNDAGTIVPDGTYTYSVSSTDLAGNKSKVYQIKGITVNTKKAPITVSVSEPYISPNGDGVKDSTLIRLTQETQEPVASWSLSLDNPQGTTVRSVEQKGQFPGTVRFDGKDANGQVLPDGKYSILFQVTLENGNVESAKTSLVINTTPAKVGITLSERYISPNGDGVKDSETASLSAVTNQPIADWQIALLSSSGTVVEKGGGDGSPPSTLSWNGTGPSGKVVPDGDYRAAFSVTLKDGTSSQATAPLTVDTTPPRVEVSASTPIFTPNSNDTRNRETVTINSNEPVTWQGTLMDSKGHQAYATTQPMSVQTVVLNRSTPSVASAPNGIYSLDLTFTDRAGNRTKAQPVSITVITKPISVTVSTAPVFSPNGDGRQDVLPVTIKTTSEEQVSKWDISVLDSSGKAVADHPGTGALPTDFNWNGVVGEQNGKKVMASNGTYTLRLFVNYENGLSGQAVSNSFVVNTTPPTITTSATPSAFILNGRGIEGSVSASVEVRDAKSKVVNWSAEVLSPNGSVLRRYAGQGNPSQQLTWRGTLPVPGRLPREVSSYPYSVRITATDSVGNRTTVTPKVMVEVIGKKRPDGKIQMLVPNILFGLYKYGLDSRSPQQGAENLRILYQVYRLLQKYPSYNLEVDGYSMEIYKPGTREYKREESIIIPLSKNRSETARNILVNMGLSKDRVIAKHFGGQDTLVDPHNVDLRWQNRRVEFILVPSL